MDNKKIGDFISTLRKNRNLTQKDLADQLGITDKAVSKWERGAGYPDIGMLRPLADILGTTVNELLDGEASERLEQTHTNDLVNALEYAGKVITMKENRLGKILAAIITISLMIAVFTCVLIDVLINHSLTWSSIVTVGCVFSWFLLIPPLVYKGRGFLYSLYSLTALIMPLLALIQTATSDYGVFSGWLWKVGFPIAATWLITIWFLLFLYRKTKINIWFFISVGAILCIPGNIITNYVVDLFVGELDHTNSRIITTVSSVIGFLTIAGVCSVIGLLRKKGASAQ